MKLLILTLGLVAILAGAALIHPGAGLVALGLVLLRAAMTLEGANP